MAQDRVGTPARHIDGEAHPVAALHLIGHVGHRAHELRHVHGLHVGARQFRVETRGVGYVADEPIQATHVMLDDVEQTPARLVAAGHGQGLDRAA